jgi:hypothetical protein
MPRLLPYCPGSGSPKSPNLGSQSLEERRLPQSARFDAIMVTDCCRPGGEGARRRQPEQSLVLARPAVLSHHCYQPQLICPGQ